MHPTTPHTPKERRKRHKKTCGPGKKYGSTSVPNQRIKYKKMSQKETKLLLKVIPECTKSHRLFKNFAGEHAPGPPRMALRLRRSQSHLRCSISAAPTKNRWLRLCSIMLNWLSVACVAQWGEHVNIAHLYF